MRRSCALHLLLFSSRSAKLRARCARAKSEADIFGGVGVSAVSGCSRGHSWTPCCVHHPKTFGLGIRSGLHSTHSDSGTPCSAHQSSLPADARPMSEENEASFQPV